MSAFDTINYFFYGKRKHELDVELLEDFNPHLTTKTLSFYDPSVANYVNDTLNSYQHIFTTDVDRFKFFENMIPKLKRKKYEYLKKPKVEVDKTDSVPIPEFYSEREMKMLLTLDIE